MYSEQNTQSCFQRLQMPVFGFSEKETGTKGVAIATNSDVVLFLL